MTTFGERLKTERLRARMSQQELAGSDLSHSYVSLLESGQRPPTRAALTALARRLQVTVEYLTEGLDAPNERRALEQLAAAEALLSAGDAQAALDMVEQMQVAQLSRHHHHHAWFIQGRAEEILGRIDDSIVTMERILELAAEDGRDADAAVIAMNLVATLLEAGSLNRAIEVGHQAQDTAESAGLAGTDKHLRLASTVLWAHFERGDGLYSSYLAANLVKLADERGTDLGRGSIYWNAALIWGLRGETDRARDACVSALALMERSESARDLPRLRYDYGWLLLRMTPVDPRVALEQFALAAPALATFGSNLELARLTIETGRAHMLLGNPQLAKTLARKGLDMLGSTVNLDVCEGHLLLGDLAAEAGDLQAATDEYQWASDRLSMMAAGRRTAALWGSLAQRFAERGEHEASVEAMGRALDQMNLRSTRAPAKALAPTLA